MCPMLCYRVFWVRCHISANVKFGKISVVNGFITDVQKCICSYLIKTSLKFLAAIKAIFTYLYLATCLFVSPSHDYQRSPQRVLGAQYPVI